MGRKKVVKETVSEPKPAELITEVPQATQKPYAYTPFGKAKVLFVENGIVTVEFADKSKKTVNEKEVTYCD